jgi:hypothetical protein
MVPPICLYFPRIRPLQPFEIALTWDFQANPPSEGKQVDVDQIWEGIRFKEKPKFPFGILQMIEGTIMSLETRRLSSDD